ncbi:hypothetical protein GCM10009727_21530 [Actinomadura napierensis]|uniref:Uncharacterized protein n=1 Tax=Actinomadura napierensis TaxID=267854 RepID=A0ABP5KAZ8_9ACTN
MEGGDGRVAVQGAGERMLAATRSKDEYSHVTRAYWSGRTGVGRGKTGIRPGHKGVMDTAGGRRAPRRDAGEATVTHVSREPCRTGRRPKCRLVSCDGLDTP